MLTQERIKELLHYCPKTGVFTWLINMSNSIKVGREAGHLGHGYRTIRVDRNLYLAHRLAFLYMTGEMPRHQVDHIDQSKANNRWSNLRAATNLENHKNRPLNKNNKSGVSGVSWNNKSGKWVSQITVDGKSVFLGHFKRKDKAIEARKKANTKYGFHPNHGQSSPTVA